MAHPGGRPSKYDPIFIEKIDEYIATIGSGKEKLPTKEGFALFIGVDDETLDNWAKKKKKDENGNDTGELERPEFLGALRKLTLNQKIQLMNDGVYGGKDVNPTIVKLLLENNHGMREKHDVDNNLKGELKVNMINYGDNNSTQLPGEAVPSGVFEASPEGN